MLEHKLIDVLDVVEVFTCSSCWRFLIQLCIAVPYNRCEYKVQRQYPQ